ncbi:alpha/beta fold hydrolase [Neorhodopirellula lusitana]|uniref:alpha/beta fold hydrolase n=1 Tax=Neorhodopirellula lusitana TaxID=445327 RepID=UPI0038502322
MLHTQRSFLLTACCLLVSITSPAFAVADQAVSDAPATAVAASEDTPAGQLEKHLETKPKSSLFQGFTQHEFQLDGAACKLVSPATPAPTAPWIWRARFWGHQPQLDVALLNQGWHVCYCDIADLFGNDAAVDRWNQFYELSQQIGLNPKPVLEGMSRGGLIVMRWASVNPDHVSGIYVDNAVMDIRSWPGGKGKGIGGPRTWKTCLAAYQMTDEETEAIDDGPLHRLAGLAKAGVPIFAMINEADNVVPPSENSDLLVKRYRELGGTITELRRPGLGHHPHSLKDPAPLVEFAIQAIQSK